MEPGDAVSIMAAILYTRGGMGSIPGRPACHCSTQLSREEDEREGIDWAPDMAATAWVWALREDGGAKMNTELLREDERYEKRTGSLQYMALLRERLIEERRRNNALEANVLSLHALYKKAESELAAMKERP